MHQRPRRVGVKRSSRENRETPADHTPKPPFATACEKRADDQKRDAAPADENAALPPFFPKRHGDRRVVIDGDGSMGERSQKLRGTVHLGLRRSTKPPECERDRPELRR